MAPKPQPVGVKSKASEAEAVLYERLAGPAWGQVGEAVRSLHITRAEVQARGVFQVRHGQGLIARTLAWLLRLPSPADATPVQLTVTRTAQGEKWVRVFGRRRLVSIQRAGTDGLLAEQFGPIELRFQLAVVSGTLRYVHQGTALTLGPLRLPLPDGLAPRVVAAESAAGSRADRTLVSVSVSLPVAGLLLSYQGELEVEAIPS